MSAGGSGLGACDAKGAPFVGIFTGSDILRALGYFSNADLARVICLHVDIRRSGDDRTLAHGG